MTESELKICPICKQPTHVSIDRETPKEQGWGCLTCCTAKEYTITCQWKLKNNKLCNKLVKRYFTNEQQTTNKWGKYCDEHVLEYYKNLEYVAPRVVDVIPQRIKDERRTYANDQLQSHRQGELSREFLEAHPKRAKQMLRDGVISKEDVKKSKYVWKGDVPGVIKKVDAEALTK